MPAGGRTTIVGAGIVGALTAFTLARAGLNVRLLEAAGAPAAGVSGRSFGWINTLAIAPEPDIRRFGLHLAALRHFEALDALLPDGLPGARTGALVWKADDAATMAFARDQADAGATVSLCDQTRIQALAPLLAKPPVCAVHAPNEWALDVTALCHRLVDAARALGAEIGTGTRVQHVRAGPRGGAVVTTDDEALESEYVVVAAGAASAALLPDMSLSGRLETSAASLIRLRVERAPDGPVCQAPDLEWRAAGPNAVLLADDPPEDQSAAARARLGLRNLEILRGLMPAVGAVELVDVRVGQRPMPAGKRPLVGPLAQAPAILLAVAHPGVILAPAIAESIQGLITQRPVDNGLTADPIWV